MGTSACESSEKQPGGVFLGGVWFSRNLAHCSRRPRCYGWGSYKIGQRSRCRIGRNKSFLPGRLFSASLRLEQLADGILHVAQPEKSSDGTGAQRERRTDSLSC